MQHYKYKDILFVSVLCSREFTDLMWHSDKNIILSKEMGILVKYSL